MHRFAMRVARTENEVTILSELHFYLMLLFISTLGNTFLSVFTDNLFSSELVIDYLRITI